MPVERDVMNCVRLRVSSGGMLFPAHGFQMKILSTNFPADTLSLSSP